jgi:hypothetical protein
MSLTGRIRWFFAGSFAAVLAWDAALYAANKLHGHFSFENFPGYGIVVGLAATALITAISKGLGKILLQHKDGYYD